MASFDDYNKYIRLLVLVHYGGLKVCGEIIHDPKYCGLPKKEKDLYNHLTNKITIKFRKCLFPDQEAILFPKDKKTKIALFDLTLITKVIFECLKITPDMKKRLMQLKDERNDLSHRGENVTMSDADFDTKWNDLETLLSNLGLDISTVTDLKVKSLDGSTEIKLAHLQAKLDTFGKQSDENKKKLQQLQLSLCAISDAMKNQPKIVEEALEIMEKSINVLREDMEESIEVSMKDLMSLIEQSNEELYERMLEYQTMTDQRLDSLEEDVAEHKIKLEEMEETKATHFVEYAKSGESKCNRCKKRISKSEIRLGIEVEQHTRNGNRTTKKWYHRDCFLKTFEKVSFSNFFGTEKIKIEDLKQIYVLINDSKMPERIRDECIKRYNENAQQEEQKLFEEEAYLEKGVDGIIKKLLKKKLEEKTVDQLKVIVKPLSGISKLRKEALVTAAMKKGIKHELVRNIAKEAIEKEFKMDKLKEILVNYKLKATGKATKSILINRLLDAAATEQGPSSS